MKANKEAESLRFGQTGHFLTIWLNIAVQDRETIQAVKKALGDHLWPWLDVDFTDDAEPHAQA